MQVIYHGANKLFAGALRIKIFIAQDQRALMLE
jgi:hypothetical protein